MEAIEARAGTLDLLITTMNSNIDWDAYIGMLGPFGRVHVVGAVMDPIPVRAFSLINAGTFDLWIARYQPLRPPINGRFCRSTQDSPQTEHFPIESINEAFDHLLAGNARYRLVLDLPS